MFPENILFLGTGTYTMQESSRNKREILNSTGQLHQSHLLKISLADVCTQASENKVTEVAKHGRGE